MSGRENPQRKIIIHATIYTDTHPASISDDILDCVDYSDLSTKIRAHVERSARMTVEALANDLAGLCLQDPKVIRVIIRVDKPGAIPEAESVGVEVERSNQP